MKNTTKITQDDARTFTLNNGKEVTVYRINRDVNGNPRAVVHFTQLGLENFDSVKGLTKYRGKAFGGGYVFQAYDIRTSLHYMQETVKAHNAAQAANA